MLDVNRRVKQLVDQQGVRGWKRSAINNAVEIEGDTLVLVPGASATIELGESESGWYARSNSSSVTETLDGNTLTVTAVRTISAPVIVWYVEYGASSDTITILQVVVVQPWVQPRLRLSGGFFDGTDIELRLGETATVDLFDPWLIAPGDVPMTFTAALGASHSLRLPENPTITGNTMSITAPSTISSSQTRIRASNINVSMTPANSALSALRRTWEYRVYILNSPPDDE